MNRTRHFTSSARILPRGDAGAVAVEYLIVFGTTTIVVAIAVVALGTALVHQWEGVRSVLLAWRP